MLHGVSLPTHSVFTPLLSLAARCIAKFEYLLVVIISSCKKKLGFVSSTVSDCVFLYMNT